MVGVLLDLTRFALDTSSPGKPASVLLAPAVTEAGLRLLLARCEHTKGFDLDSYQFWIIAGKAMLEDPTLCAKVAESGVLADSAAWLARQLEQGLLSPHMAERLVGWLDLLFMDATEALVQLAGGERAQTDGDPESQEPADLALLMEAAKRLMKRPVTGGFWLPKG
ncbi:hypothetical protein N2152v2_005401 [Parachlorella kessleri]